MKRLLLIVLGTMLLSMCLLYADDIDVKLTGTDTNHGLSVFDNASTPANLFRVRSDGKVGIGTSSPNFKFDVRGNIGISASGYLNFGTTDGTSGYGFRDNSGIMEYKNSAGSWTPFPVMPTVPANPYDFGSSSFSYGQIAYNHGNYGTTQPTVEIGSSTAYETMFPVTLGSGGGTPWETYVSGGVSIAEISGKPAYLKITQAGVYRITASIALLATANTAIEVEVFRQNSGSVPLTTSWTTGTHDLESLSTAMNATNGKYASGSVTGMYYLNENDYLALCSRVLDGSTNTQKVICINLNAERIK